MLFPAALDHDAPAATTDEVSLIAVPAHIPKPVSDNPSICPSGGKIKTAMMLNKNMVEIAWATSSSLARITGAVAAIAEPPHIEVPTPIRVVVLPSIFIAFPTRYAVINDEDNVNTITRSD